MFRIHGFLVAMLLVLYADDKTDLTFTSHLPTQNTYFHFSVLFEIRIRALCRRIRIQTYSWTK